MTESSSMSALVNALPEKYQPIFGHGELSDGSSRSCEDRLLLIRECAQRLQVALGRPLRILDLGCAQGFFSLSLAAEGHQVRGVDFLDLNIHVCQALAAEHPDFLVSFEHGTVEDVIDRLNFDEYDLVLGLSVFHHLIHERGVINVANLCRKLSETTAAALYELALREEPLYWSASLPHDPAELLAGYSFVRLLSRQVTHLSVISRPLYFASSRYWYVDHEISAFDSWSADSHAHGFGTHQHSRRYYFSEQYFVKKMTLGFGGRADINLREFNNEVAFLRKPPDGYVAPKLIAALNDASDLFLVRENMPGKLLSEFIDEGVSFDSDRVIAQLLEQLIVLERSGLHHNDVRCWNVLMSPAGDAVLIDYGAISEEAKDCSWLEDLLLSFLITTKEILDRRIVQSKPGREPALDLMSLPPRYRNAFVDLFDRADGRWTFATLRDCLAQASDVSLAAPGWVSIYQRLQQALVSYNQRLAALVEQSRHDRVELEAQVASLAQARESALQSQERLSTLEQQIVSADSRCASMEKSRAELAEWASDLESRVLLTDAERTHLHRRTVELEAVNADLASRVQMLESALEEQQRAGQAAAEQYEEAEARCRKLKDWACELEANAARSQASSEQLSARLIELEKANAEMVGRIEELVGDLDSTRHTLKLAEGMAADVMRLTEERDALYAEVAHAQSSNREHERTIGDREAKVSSLLGRIARFETSRAHDRRRLQELQADLSQRAQLITEARLRVRELEAAVELLEAQMADLYASRSWRLTAPLRWFTTRVLGRGSQIRSSGLLVANGHNGGRGGGSDLPSPADAAVDKRLAGVDQLGSRIRKTKQ